MSVFTELSEIIERTYAEHELAFACLTNTPITPGHTLVIPKREVAAIDELTEDEWVAIRELTLRVKEILRKAGYADGFNFGWNEGRSYGQSVPHIHLHVVPRTPGDAGITAYEPRKFLYRPGTRAETPENELADFAKSLRSETSPLEKSS